MRLMITGATGFLGSRALSVWKETHTVEVLPSALLRGEMTRERTEALAAALSAFAPEVLLHTAAISDTGFAERSPDIARQANVELPQTLARLCAAQGCKMLFCSSDQVYNGCPGKGPFAESEPLAPLNVYGRQKLEAEAPLAEMFKYATDLRSMTQARGSFVMKFVRYEEVPANVAQKIIDNAKHEDEEEE